MSNVVVFGSHQSAFARQAELDRDIHDSWASISADQVRAKIRALDGHPQRNLWGLILGGALAKHAPHHAGLLPPGWLPQP